MACRYHNTCSSTEMVHPESHHWRRSFFVEKPDGNTLRDEGVGRKCSESRRIMARIVSNYHAVGGNLRALISHKLSQSLRSLYDNQRVHASESCRHATTKTSSSELNTYVGTKINYGPTRH